MIAANCMFSENHRTSQAIAEFTMALDNTQARALVAFKNGKSIAIIGGAGSGKSYLLQEILQKARSSIGHYPFVAACALTNQASFALGGSTIHSLFGAPSHWEFSPDKLVEIVRKSPKKKQALLQTKLLVIDEISLLSAAVFNSIDAVFRDLAPTDLLSSLPFGGRQLVVAGDPFQLEAIGIIPSQCRASDAKSPVFSSITWFICYGGLGTGVFALLSRNHRQSEDIEFFHSLERIRCGSPTDDDIRRINETSANSSDPPQHHTTLCLYRSQVRDVNKTMLSNITGKLFSNIARDYFHSKPTNALQRRLRQAALDIVELKVGCYVILTKKLGRYIPGTRAVVCHAEENSDKNLAQVTVKVLSSSDTGNIFAITPQKTSILNIDTTVMAYRMQFPLIPAYALTVHRSQGLTLSKVSIDFSDIEDWKPNGMVYVALSRCKTLRGLWVKGLTKDHINVSYHAETLMNKIFVLKNHFPDRVMGFFPVKSSITQTVICNGQSMKVAGSKRQAISSTFSRSKRCIPFR